MTKTNIIKKIPFIIAIVGTLLMIATLLLPYATATEQYKEDLMSYSDEIVYDKLDMTAKDIVNVSMLEYAKVYGKLGDVLGGSGYGAFYVGMVVAIGITAALALLFALLKKPVAVALFSLISTGVFWTQSWDYADRGVVPSSDYIWGAGYYVFYIAATLAIVGAVWLLIDKIRSKMDRKAEQTEN